MGKRRFLIIGLALFIALVAVSSALFVRSSSAAPPSNLSSILGDWTNVDPSTGGIVRVVVSEVDGDLRVRTFGNCQPTPCDHGTVDGSPYGTSVLATKAKAFTAMYDFGFKTQLVTAWRTGDRLTMRHYHIFDPGDNRTDYFGVDKFVR